MKIVRVVSSYFLSRYLLLSSTVNNLLAALARVQFMPWADFTSSSFHLFTVCCSLLSPLSLLRLPTPVLLLQWGHHHSLNLLLCRQGGHHGSWPGLVHVSFNVARRRPKSSLWSVLLMARHLLWGRSSLIRLSLVVPYGPPRSSARCVVRKVTLLLAVERSWRIFPGRPEHWSDLRGFGFGQLR